jgi:hypothetical protein
MADIESSLDLRKNDADLIGDPYTKMIQMKSIEAKAARTRTKVKFPLKEKDLAYDMASLRNSITKIAVTLVMQNGR